MKYAYRLLAVLLVLLSFLSGRAQVQKKEVKPYSFTASGRQITIKSSKAIQNVMLWTTDGHRVIEQKAIHNSYVRLDIPVYRKTFFLMIELIGGKIYTEKIGIL